MPYERRTHELDHIHFSFYSFQNCFFHLLSQAYDIHAIAFFLETAYFTYDACNTGADIKKCWNHKNAFCPGDINVLESISNITANGSTIKQAQKLVFIYTCAGKFRIIKIIKFHIKTAILYFLYYLKAPFPYGVEQEHLDVKAISLLPPLDGESI